MCEEVPLSERQVSGWHGANVRSEWTIAPAERPVALGTGALEKSPPFGLSDSLCVRRRAPVQTGRNAFIVGSFSEACQVRYQSVATAIIGRKEIGVRWHSGFW